MLLYEKLTEEEHVESSVVGYVFELINRMKRCQELAILHMKDAKQKQKLWYDRRTVRCLFQLGELVLVIAPSRPNKLSVQWVGPGEIVQQLSDTNYVVKFPEKDNTHVYHVNMLKPYHQREENINLLCINPLKHDKEDIPSLELENERSGWSKIISDVQLNSKLSQIQRGQLKELLYEYSNLFSNIPGCTDLAEHDIELESERAIVLLSLIGKEARPCIDYRRLNKVTRIQFFPLPNIEELLEKVSTAKYISILDLTRGYLQIPLSPRAQKYASFETTFGTFKPLRLPFGLKNAPYYFSRLMANLLRNCEDFAVPYLDDIAIFSLAWDDHLKHLKDVFEHLRSAKLHIKPSKCQFAQAYVKYLGHLVGQGLRTPGELKVQVIKDFPILTNKMQGRNRKSTVDWNTSCQNAFEELKTRLSKNPVLYNPDFTKPFIIQCDASNLGIGVVLSQRRSCRSFADSKKIKDLKSALLYALKVEAATQASCTENHSIREAKVTTDELCESRCIKEIEKLIEEMQALIAQRQNRRRRNITCRGVVNQGISEVTSPETIRKIAAPSAGGCGGAGHLRNNCP
ncbi:retrovirus-related Pol polyprotein from transposon 297 [Trichonephila clavipes]|nr:retrovirus-related Pol polyprotein from transposon 297 [Trichonephila clavipes]